MVLKGWLANILVLLRQSSRRIARGAKRLRTPRRRQLPVEGQFCFLTSGEVLESRLVLTPPTISPQAFSVPENSANGTAIGTVAATDPDVGDTMTFLITGGNTLGAFAISPSGVIRVADSRKLNYELISTFNLTVRVTDSTGAFASNTVTVNLTNVNEAPGISPQSFSLPENTANGTVVGSVIASDADAGDTKTFSITGGNSLGAFAISSAGVITVADTSKLNYEATQSFALTVTVTDSGNLSASNTVTINVTNVNEAPVIAPQSFSLAENSPVNSTVGAVIASDPDANDTKSFAITAGNSLGAFSITRSGIIRVADPTHLDFETHPTFTLTVTVTDAAGLSASNTVTINLTDVNEAPVAVDGSLSTTEGSPVSGTLVATDVDLNSLVYSILDYPEFGTVTITNPATGAYTYTPNANYFGSDSFTFQANDGSLNSNLAIVSITISPLNNAPTAEDGVLTTDEDTPVGGTLVATDIDSGSLVYSIVTPPTYGTVTITDPATGAYLYTPGPDFNGEDTFTFKASDGVAFSNVATVVVTIDPVNDAPVAEDGTLVTDEDVPGHGFLEATDIDSTDLAYFIVDQPQFGTVTITNPLTGAYTYTPNSNYHGSDYFLFQATDGSATSNVAKVDVTVTSVNDAPVLVAIANKTVDEEVQLTFAASASDVDRPSQTLTYSLDAASILAGMTINPTTGQFSWTPTESQGGSVYTVIVTVTDNGSNPSNLTDSKTFTITVNEVNVAPELNAIGNKTVNEETLLTFTATATDHDIPAQQLSFSLVGAPSGATITSGGVFTWTPTESQGPGTYTFNVVVSDGSLTDSESITVTVNEVNVAPELNPIGNKTVSEETLLTFTATATDHDIPAQTLVYSLVNAPSGASITAGGVFTWTPTEVQGPGTYTFDVVVSDGTLTDSETITVTVNEVNVAPELNAIGNKTVNEETLLTFTATATDHDIPAQTLTFSLVNAPAGASITSGGVFTWTPTEVQGPGTYTFDVVVSDGSLSDSETITVTVNEVNVAPELNAIGNKTVNEETLLTFTASATDHDIPAQTLTFSLVNAPSGASITSGGVFTWTPTEGQGPGTYTFDVVVSDGALSDSETITVTVNEVNVAPELNAIGNKTVNEETLLTFTATATDHDIPAQTLTFSLVNAPAGASITPGGVFTWTPTEGQGPGTYTFDVVVSDGALSDSETITVTVNEVNVAPELAAIGNKTVNEETLLTFTATATDHDVPVQTLTFSLVNAPAGASITSGGVFTWTPTEGQGPGTYTFDVVVSDGTLTDSETITVTVNEVNVAPELAAIGNKTVNEETLLTFTATATDHDIPIQTLTFSLVNAPAGASITSGGVFTWTPTEGQGPGTYTFDVVVSDGALSDSETITVTVNEVNVAPELNLIGNKTVNEETLLTFTATATDHDVPVQTLTFSLVNAPAGASITSGGVFTWTPTEGQGPGTYTFDVVVSDGALSDSETITVTVNEVNVAPELNLIGNKTVNEETLLTFTATATDHDIPVQSLTFSLVGAPAGATITAGGVFTWTPTEGQGPGIYTFDVVVSDGSLSDSETITVTVNEVNVAPELNAIGNKTVNEETLLTFTATATDHDIPAQTLTFSLVNAPAGASITSGGVFTWTPTEGQGPGTYTFDVVVSDGALSDSETITVTVNEVNVAPELTAIGNKTVNEETLLTFTATATDHDVPVQTLTFSLVNAPAGASITSGGVFTWTPTEGQGPGTYTFDVVVSDGALSDSETITVTVNEVNVAPELNAIGNKTVNEETLLTFTATATDHDVPVQTLTFSLVNAPAGASITSGGVFTWTPTEGQGPGTYTFDVVVSDGALSDSETITVTVNEVNVAPELNLIGNKTVNEETLLTFTATATDHDVPVQTLTFSLVNAPAGASITSGGVFTWTPTEGQGPGTYTFDVVVSDGALSDSETITVTVNEVNVAPELTAIGNKTVNEETLLTFTATATDHDIPVQTLTFSLVNAPAGASITSGGVFTWTPTEGQGPGTYTFDVVVSDGALSDSETITVTVNEVNVAPELNLIGNKTVNEETLLTFTATATDHDLPAQTLVFSLVNAPAGASITSGGVFTWTPTEVQGPGTYTFDVVVSDGTLSDSETITVTVNEVNVAPELALIGNKTVNEETLLTFTATATDHDIPAQTLTFSLVGAPVGATITSGGVFTWTPTEVQGPGTYTFDVVVSDGTLTDSETITVTVNEVNVAPELNSIGNKTVNEETLLTFTATATDHDLPAQTLVFSLVNAPSGASITSGGVFTWTPTESQGPGTYTFDVVVSDGALSDSETITVTVNEVNVAPELALIGNKTVNEETLLTFTASATDHDIPGQTLTFSLVNAPAGASITSGGFFTWTPTEGQGPGTYTFDVVVSDGALSDSETITVTVNEVNVAPELALIGNKTVNEETLLTFTASATDHDIPGQTLTFSLVNAPAGASITSGGVFTWTPSEGQGPGTYTFDVVVSDGALSDSETITVTVNEVNVAPELNAIGNKTVNEETLLTFTATATDHDLPAQTLVFSLVGAPVGASITSGGVFTWTPSETQGPGTYTFDVVVSDGTLTDSETISVTVNEVNVAPELTAIGNKTVNEETLLTFTATATDHDIPVQTLTFSLVNAPAGASITSGGVFTWTPTEGQGPGTYTFDVVVSDGTLSDSETITVTVNEVNVAPELNAIGNKTVNEETLLTFTATATDHDLPAQALTFSLVNAPAGASITSAGVFTWTPAEGQGPGTYTFDVVVSDGALSDSETITVTVNEVNVAPELTAIGNKTVNEETLLTFTATATDHDIPVQTLTFSLVNAPAGASITSGGVFTWTPTEGQGPGTYTFDVVVSDGTLSDSETITVTVNEVNVAPELALIGNKTVNEETLLTFTATATDHDIPVQTLTFSLVNAPAGASITSSGVFTWTPTEGQGPGTYTFDVVVSDGTLTDSESITVTVNEVNVAPELNAIGNKTVSEETLLTFTATATDHDIPVQTLTFSLVNAPAGASISSAGVFTWTPAEGQGPGTYTFDVVVSDGVLSDSETITVTVNEVNVAPELTLIGNKSVSEETLLTFTATATDHDIPVQTLTFSLVNAPAGASITSGGVFTWTPTEGQGPGTYTFDVVVSDGTLTDSETITVTVNEVNVAPELTAIGNKTVDEETLLTFTATATDHDLPGQTLTFSLVGAPAGASITSGGVFTWTPTEVQGPGTYTFDVVVSDGSLSDSETITVTVNEVNVAPELTAIGNKTVNEETLLTFTATATDHDLPAQTLIFSLVGAPAGASITSGGVFTWTPTEVQGPGTYTFDVVVSDGTLSDSETITVTVNEVNVAPELNLIGNKTVNEETLLTFTATATDHDIPAQTLTFSLVGAPAGASITAGGVFTWTPTEVQGPGTYTFDVVVSDGTLTDSETITVTVNEVNVAPELTAIGNKTVAEETLLTFTATATDHDLPAQTLVFSLVNAPAGASITSGGVFTWTPAEGQGPGTYTFDVVVSDGTLTDSETITVTVNEVNVAPELTAIGNKTVNEETLLTFTATATDHDLPAQTLVFSLVNAPAGASITSGGVFTWTPTEGQGPGTYTFDVVVSDGALSDSETITVTVNEVNVAPELAAIGNKTVDEETLLTFTATATDHDIPVQTLTFSLVNAPAGASITSGGVFTWTPTEVQGPGTYTFDVVVSDGTLTDSETITVTVNEVNVAPELTAIGNKTVDEETLLTFTATATDHDLPGQTLTFSLVGAPAGASITAGGVFTWTPTEVQGPGTYTFDVVVSDGTLTDSETITVTVNEVNVAPELTLIGNKTVNEETLLTFTATATDHDIPAQTLTFSLVNAPAGASITSGGVFTWTPTEGQGPGTYTFDVVVSDGTLTDSETITVTVNEVNVAPELTAIGNKTVDEETLLTFTATATDHDLPGQTLTFSLVGAPAGASITSAGVFTWTPTEVQGPGTYTFDVVVSDGALTDSETITVTVNEVNVAPELTAIGNKTVNEETLLTFTATATDHDLPGQTLVFSLVGAPAGASITAGGVFTWTPTEVQGPGTYTFDVVVSDGTLSDSETITVTVNEVNVAPELNLIGNKTVDEETLLTFTATATDHDVPGQTLTFSLVNAPSGASITSGGVFTWTPTEGQGPGTYTFDVVVSDGTLTDSETITVTVNEVNVAPELTAIGNKTVDEETLLTFTATATDHDLPAQTLTFSLVNAPAGASITSGGVFTWTPTEGQGPGTYTFDVVVSDGTLSDSETITVTVNEVNVAPELTAIGNKTVNEETLLTFTATATDHDLPTQSLTFSLVNAPAGASITSGGVFTWTPTEGQGPGTYTFDVVVSDGALSDSETITVTVNEVNVAPELTAIGNKTVNEETLLTFTATATDHDVPAQQLTFSLVGAPAGASITSGGVFTWTPTEGQGPGTYTFDVVVSDGTLSDSETITVTVNEVNVAPELTAIGNKTVNEETLLTFTATATDHDLPAQTLTFSLVNAPAGASITSGGVFTWTPSESQGPGTYTFDVVVSDGTLSDSETITVTVNEVNVAPELTAIGNKTVDEETLLTFTATATDHDVPGQTLTFSLVGAPAGAAITSGGVFTWTPTESQGPGTYTFDVVVSDGTLTDSETITVTVNEVNVAPTIDPQSFTIAENTANGVTVGTVVANDVDGGTLTFTITGGNQLGAFAISSGGVITVADTTKLDFETTPTFTLTVKVTDAGGLFAANTVTINLTNENDPPVANSQSITTDEDVQVSGQAVANDLELDPLTYLLVTGPTHGSLTFNSNGTFTYTPGANYNGADSFTFKANDGTSDSNVATVSITVNPVNDTPTIAPQSFTLAENSSNGTVVGTVVANDVDSGDTQAFTITGGNSLGAFAISNSGVITVADYSKLDFETTPTFNLTVRVTDGGGLFASNTVTINLTDVNETPTIAPQTFTVEERKDNGYVIGTVVAFEPDAGDTKTFAITAGNNGAFAISSAGVLTVADTTKYSFAGTPSFGLTVSVTDSVGHTTSATITITVTEYVPVLTGYQLQLGQTQKSYIRYIDLTFGSSYGLSTLLSAGAIRLSRQDLLTSQTAGVNDLSPTSTSVSLTGLVTVDTANKKLKIDFGAGGIGGIASSVTGDGYYTLELDLDRDGIFETTKHFYRLLGDGNGDRLVATADAAFDLNGDGVVNSNDTTIATRSRGRRISSSLVVDPNF